MSLSISLFVEVNSGLKPIEWAPDFFRRFQSHSGIEENQLYASASQNA